MKNLEMSFLVLHVSLVWITTTVMKSLAFYGELSCMNQAWDGFNKTWVIYKIDLLPAKYNLLLPVGYRLSL